MAAAENLDHREQASVDAGLVEACAAGESAALADLYDRHSGRMLAAALRVLTLRSDAEDLVHDVFMEVWQCAHQYRRHRGTVISWMLTRVRSRAIDRLRSLERARRAQRAALPPEPAQVQEPQLSLRAQLADLSENQRTVLELSYFRGLTCSEIASHCRLPLGTVKSRLSAGLKHLRQRLMEPYDND